MNPAGQTTTAATFSPGSDPQLLEDVGAKPGLRRPAGALPADLPALEPAWLPPRAQPVRLELFGIRVAVARPPAPAGCGR